MIFENETTIVFSILIEPNDNYITDFDLEDNPYTYKILRSYNNGLTWSHLATMRASDLEEAHETVDLLNRGAQKNNTSTNVFGGDIKKADKNYPHNHRTSNGYDVFFEAAEKFKNNVDYYIKYKKQIDAAIDQSIDPKDEGLK
jgi:hypothetical protein